MSALVAELRAGQLDITQPVARNLAELAVTEPERGVYLVTRTWQRGKVLELDRHFDRMQRSAAALGPELQVPRDELRTALAALLADGQRRWNWADIRFRITAVLDADPWYRIAAEEAVDLDPASRTRGVDCRLAEGAARSDAKVKSTAWMHERRALGEATDGAPPYEWLLTGAGGGVFEGATSNAFAVLDGTLRTASDGVLEGIARRIVLEVAPTIVAIRLDPVVTGDLPRVTEFFITSSSRGVVPVRSIDDYVYRAPGPVTGAIAVAYERWLQAHLAPLVQSR